MRVKVIKGTYNQALVFTDLIEEKAIEQIHTLCCQPFIKGSKIRIMPDVHVGVGCTIGTTMTIKDKVVPNLVGVDIGCGIEIIGIGNKKINLQKLDRMIYDKIPNGFNIRKKEHSFVDKVELEKLYCKKEVDINRARKSIGTLGGGNHFIEVNQDDDGNLYLVVHSGSRHLGTEVATYYQNRAYNYLKAKGIQVPKSLAYAEGDLFNQYIHDMKIVQHFADINRKAIVEEIVKDLDLEVVDSFSTIHNYIDTEKMILRKGAVSAKKGERFLIPINMRDGSIIALGKGNEDWNYSAPHGAGRIMSRSEARKNVTLKDYQKSMEGIYTSSVNKKTIDEAPIVYKPLSQIIENIRETAEIMKVIKPIYNFKAAE
ncbi:RtcB family protein [Anaerobranca gottschalkii]|uniref:3'-phosphate/5'-hydroxy nucleic acid ligase n=1 Tax=Anaerobranca gottschalkii DSM 13577 TaxID=1120990 RepID=A0A1I0C7W3_9FIRM|nr:RtcB family protein [Anaerobranca gottschalkii]SET15442.1 RNA-splicing ligase RtcB, repairs tRNA damage [Anaerobranca gottschalkii DSM 13577]